ISPSFFLSCYCIQLHLHSFPTRRSSDLKISTTINALSTPIISLISVILLYITLSKQIESNYFQKKSKNLDLVLVMYNQLQVEYRSEEHTSELQSRENLVCRLLLEKKKK